MLSLLIKVKDWLLMLMLKGLLVDDIEILAGMPTLFVVGGVLFEAMVEDEVDKTQLNKVRPDVEPSLEYVL